MYHRTIFCCLVLIALSVCAQTTVNTINVRGTVTAEGEAIGGAVVTLLGHDLKDTTNRHGEYSITKDVVGVLPSVMPRAEKITFRKGVLELSLRKSSPVKIEVFDVKGNLIKKEVSQNTAAGTYRMDIHDISHASNLLIVRASVGENTMTCRYIPLRNDRYLMHKSANISASSGSGKLASVAKVAAGVDSLQIVKPGYLTQVVAIESYDVSVDISLTAESTGDVLVEDAGYDCQVSSPNGSNGGSSNVLPDPFTKWDGTQVRTMDDWRCRRRELVVEIEKRILGEKAPPPAKIGGSVSGSVSNSSYTVTVDNPDGSTSFSGDVSLPNSGSAPYPAIITVGSGMFAFNSLNPEVLNSEGVATISFDAYDISSEGSGDFRTGKYFDANPDYKGKTGALVAWAWGVSRIIDMLEKNPDVIDPTKIGVHGCSRFGKAAFVIGAFDQRIALGLPLEPGTGGPAPLRALPVFGGQSLGGANGEASWFGPMAGSYSSNMAVDMSDVAVMYAPRGLLMMDNPHIDHLSYKANYLGCAAAMEVYEAMGESDALWYLGSSNNGSHCTTRNEYAEPLRAMIKKFFEGDESVTTGGLDRHSNHGHIDVSSWTGSWNKGTISE